MIAGGLDTTPACILLGLATLSGPGGGALQQKLLAEIEKVYPDGDAWQRCLDEEKVEYVTAFCKEVLRFWTVIPMSLPRVSVNDMTYQGAHIPAGTTFLMVSGTLVRTRKCADMCRTRGPPTSILNSSNRRASFRRNAFSTSQKARARNTLPLELARACAQVHTWQTV